MSYWVCLLPPAPDGTELNVTYNYSHLFRLATADVPNDELRDMGLIRWLSGRSAKETRPILELVVKRLGDKQYHPNNGTEVDYWAPTPGNAGHAASILLRWAEQHPDAIWEAT